MKNNILTIVSILGMITIYIIHIVIVDRILNNVEHIMHEYQVRIEMDSAHVYQYGRYVGSYRYADSLTGFENIVAEDNK